MTLPPILLSLLVACAGSACCTSTPYAIPEGHTADYLIHGETIEIEVDTGEVHVLDLVPMGSGFTRITLHCANSPTGTCTGTIHGCDDNAN